MPRQKKSESEIRAFAPGDRVAVLLPLPLAGAYDYRVPDGLTVSAGDFVSVPLGNRVAAGVVWGVAHGDIAAARIKDILEVLDCPPLPEVSRRFVEWVAAYTIHAPGGVLKMAMSVPDALSPPKPLTAYTANPSRPDFRLTPARARVIEIAAEGPPRTATELAREAAVGVGVIKGLTEVGALLRVQVPAVAAPPSPDPHQVGPELSADQQTAAESLEALTRAEAFSVTLLDGVPGSGKTEVYYQAVAEALEMGHQVLVLLPEIALGSQWRTRFEKRFGAPPVEWHSDLSQGQRRAAWRAVADGSARVVVGARSALFLPYRDLGLIVVDEEHDGAFKQEEGVIYNARDMAVVRAQLGGFAIVLASATPSLETVINVETERYTRLHLPDRHGGATLPDVEVIDMLIDKPVPGRWLSPALVTRIHQTLAAGEQVLLFLNRRGYAPLTLCRVCGHRFQCPRCTAWLVEHRRKSRLQCHHCGFNIGLPERCPSCDAEDSLAACGPGVERLAEEVTATFEGARIAIAASDNIATPAAAADLISRIEDHQIDIIVGTQIVAKGYHFPMLTLVGVIDADLGLQGGDLRAAERTFQLLYQVAGRAGRAERPGRVCVQTYMAEHPVIATLTSGDRDLFLQTEAEARESVGMPPFGRLVALIVSGPIEAAVDATARDLGRAAPNGDGVTVLGPAPAPFALLRGRHRRRLLLKAERRVNVQKLVRVWLARVRWPRTVQVRVDVDPYGFF